MSIDSSLADLIARGVSSAELQDLAEQQGMLSLVESAMTRVFSGVTTPQEANRVVSDPALAGFGVPLLIP